MKMFHYLPVSGLSNFAVGSVPGFDKKSIEGYWILDGWLCLQSVSRRPDADTGIGFS